MRLKLWHVPVRLATGAFILNSGFTKRDVDEDTAAQLHGAAAAAYPQLKEMPPAQFVQQLSAAEIAVGAVLLTPIVPPGVAGVVLTGFSLGLGRLYLKSASLHEEGSLRPTSQGVPVAKDVWLLGIGLGLALDALSDKLRRS